MPRLGALRELQLDGFDSGSLGVVAIPIGVEAAIGGARPEVAGSYLPNQVAARLEVVRADAPFAGVVGEATTPCPFVESHHRGFPERPEAHG